MAGSRLRGGASLRASPPGPYVMALRFACSPSAFTMDTTVDAVPTELREAENPNGAPKPNGRSQPCKLMMCAAVTSSWRDSQQTGGMPHDDGSDVPCTVNCVRQARYRCTAQRSRVARLSLPQSAFLRLPYRYRYALESVSQKVQREREKY
eukprot:1469199-Prymnesium_polylepis.1